MGRAKKRPGGALTCAVMVTRASFSLTLSAGAMLMLLDRIGPPGRCSGCWRRPQVGRAGCREGADRATGVGPLAGAIAAGAGRGPLSYGVSFATTRAHQLARRVGALTCAVMVTRASFSLTLSAGAMLMLLDRIGPPGRCIGCWRRP